MARISIDNGAHYCTAREALSAYPMRLIASYMDDDTREDVHGDLAPCTDLEFLVAYLDRAPHDLVIG